MADWTPKPARGGPARGYSWPSFTEGNTVARVAHGTRSARLIAARADEVEPVLIETAPWLAEFPLALRNVAQVVARSRMLGDHIEKVVAEKGADAVGSRLWESATAASRLEDQLLESNGLTPLGRIKVIQAQAEAGRAQTDLARLWADEGDDLQVDGARPLEEGDGDA